MTQQAINSIDLYKGGNPETIRKLVNTDNSEAGAKPDQA